MTKTKQVISNAALAAAAKKTVVGRTFVPEVAVRREPDHGAVYESVEKSWRDKPLTASDETGPGPGALELIQNRVHDDNQKLISMAERLEVIGARLCGPELKDDPKSDVPVQSGIVGEINGELDATWAIIDRICSAVERLETL